MISELERRVGLNSTNSKPPSSDSLGLLAKGSRHHKTGQKPGHIRARKSPPPPGKRGHKRKGKGGEQY